ncbi:hypothetical protein V8F06_010319 [Rhypophila decipiens]
MFGMFILLGLLILLLAIFYTRSPAPVILGPTAGTFTPWQQSFYGAATPAGGWFAFFQRLGWGMQV